MISPCPRVECQMHHGMDSIATTISRMGKEPTTLGPEDLKGHRFSAFWLKSVCEFSFQPLVFAV